MQKDIHERDHFCCRRLARGWLRRPADAAAVFEGEQHLLAERGIAAALRLLGGSRVLRIEAEADGIRHILANALRKMGIQDAAGNLRDERRIAREGEADRFGESAGDSASPQLGDRRRGAGRASGDFGRPGKLPDTVGAKMPIGTIRRDYAPIAGIFRAVIARTLRSQARASAG